MELEELTDEVYRKIGRNVTLFKKMEYILKLLVTNSEVSGYASEFKLNQEKRKETIHKQTMGTLVKQYLENSFSDSKETKNTPEELKEAWISSRITLECDIDYYENRKSTLASIVTERNHLIHSLLPKWNLLDSLRETEQYLDQQHERILPEYDLLKANLMAMAELMDEHIKFWSSDEGKKQLMLSFLRQSQLVAWLFESAQQKARSDNWVVLSTAVQFISLHAPEELTDLYKKHGYKKLKEIIVATEYFDISEEMTNKGGIRVLYRVKPDLNLPAA